MSENKFETISALVDSDHTIDHKSKQAIDEILKDEHLTKTWQHYHLIGDVMRGEVTQTLQLDLSAKIADALADEPTILSPKPSGNKKNNHFKNNMFKAKVVQLAKPFGQFAIAASAAGLMIIGVQQNTVGTNDVIIPSQVVQTIPLAGFANPVSYNFQQPVKGSKTSVEQRNEQRIAQQRRFQALLSDHQQQIKLSAVTRTDDNLIIDKSAVNIDATQK